MITITKNINRKMIEEALELDKENYPDDFILTIDQCLSYFKKNEKIYTMLLDDGRVVGYLNFSPITNELYSKLRTGEYVDTIISNDDILSYERGNVYNAYLSSIVIQKDYRNKGYANLILASLEKQIVEFAKNKIFFKRIIADVLSEGGAALAHNFGMICIRNTSHNSQIYEANLIPLTLGEGKFCKLIKDIYTKR